jgi:ActR/RegA family two-component response regulator
MKSVLLLDNDKVLSPALKNFLESLGYNVTWCDTFADCKLVLEKNFQKTVSERAGVAIVDLSFTDPEGEPGEEGFDLLELALVDQYLEAIVFTGTGNELKALKASRMGAFQYVRKVGEQSCENSSFDELAKEISLAFQCRDDLISLNEAIERVEKTSNNNIEIARLARSVLIYIFHVRGRKLES